MALSFTKETIGGKEVDILVIAGTEDEAEFFLKGALTPADIALFELIDEEDGDNLKAKMASYELSNGIYALDKYAGGIKVMGTYAALADGLATARQVGPDCQIAKATLAQVIAIVKDEAGDFEDEEAQIEALAVLLGLGD